MWSKILESRHRRANILLVRVYVTVYVIGKSIIWAILVPRETLKW